MKIFTTIYVLGFACSLGMLFYAYHYFQVGNNTRALTSLVIGIVCGIGNFKGFVEE